MLVINPDECIDCGVCVAECPVDAIVHYTGEQNDSKTLHWLGFNRNMIEIKKWPRLTQMKKPLPNAEEMSKIEDKTALIDEEPGSGN